MKYILIFWLAQGYPATATFDTDGACQSAKHEFLKQTSNRSNVGAFCSPTAGPGDDPEIDSQAELD